MEGMSNRDDIHYSMLCTPSKDGDGRKLASELRDRLKETIESFAVDRNTDHRAIRLKSCCYLSDGGNPGDVRHAGHHGIRIY